MKRFFIIIGALLVLFIAALFIIPRVFKDEIRAAIDQKLAKTIDAEVFFDTESFGLSLLTNFPNITVSLDDFGVVGKGAFTGDTLLDVKAMELEIDLFKVIGGEVVLTGLGLTEPHILILGLEDGTANYDIMIPSDAPAEEETEESESTEGESMTIAIDHWFIDNGSFVYYNLGSEIFLDLSGLTLTGGGDLTSERFDLATALDIDRVGFEYGEVKYLDGQSVNGDIILDMNYSDFTFAFKQNTLFVNDFGLSFDGMFGMPDEGYFMDLSFASEATDFKNLLSLVPALYQKDFNDLTAKGNVQFDGSLKGLYSFEGGGLPAFRFNLRVDEGEFNYPNLPSALEGVNLHLLVDNQDGIIDNTVIDLQTLKMSVGPSNPFEGKAKISGLATPEIDATLKGSLDLAAITSALPLESLEGLEVAGRFGIDLSVLGTYDDAQNLIPTFNTELSLAQGKVEYAEYPIPMKNITMAANASNRTGKLDDTEIDLKNLHLSLDGEEFLVKGSLQNLADYTWNATLEGGLDLGKIAQVVHLEDMELAGHMDIHLSTAGKYSALKAERYDQLPTSGTLNLENFRFTSPDVPQPIAISTANFNFSPQQAAIEQLDMTLGKSDIRLSGAVSNYLAFIMEENAVLKGRLDLESNTLDLNQLMASENTEEEDSTTDEDTTSSSFAVVEVPKTIDFQLNSNMSKVYYDNLTLEQVRGKIWVRDGVVRLDGLNFNSLDGRFAVSGTYNTQDMEHPQVDLDLDVKEVSIRSAYLASGIVRRLAPVAENMTGNFSTEFSLQSELEEDMMPDYGTLTGAGLIAVAKAALNSGPIVSGLAEASKLGAKADGVTLKDIILSARIENGRLRVSPFDVKVGQYTTNVAGSTGLDGSLDYLLKMEVPAGSAGQAFNSLVSNLTGNSANANSSTINLNLGLEGQYREPKISLRGTSTGSGGTNASLADQVTAEVRNQASEAIAETKEQLEQQAQETLATAKDSAASLVNETVDEAKEELQQQAQQAAEEARNKIRDLFRRRGGGGKTPQ